MMNSGQVNVLNFLGQAASTSSRNMAHTEVKSNNNNEIDSTVNKNKFAQILNAEEGTAHNKKAGELTVDTNISQEMALKSPRQLNSSGKQLPLKALNYTGELEELAEEFENSSFTNELNDDGILTALSDSDSDSDRRSEEIAGDLDTDKPELTNLDAISNIELRNPVAETQSPVDKDAAFVGVDSLFNLSPANKSIDSENGILPSKLDTDIYLTNNALSLKPVKSNLVGFGESNQKPIPVFYRDVLPRFGDAFNRNVNAAGDVVEISSDEANDKSFKLPELSKEFDWLKDGKKIKLSDDKKLFSDIGKMGTESTKLDLNLGELKSGFSSLLQREIQFTHSTSQLESSVAISQPTANFDSKDASAIRLPQVLSANVPFNEGLNLKGEFAPNLAMRIQWMFNQALSSAEILMDPPEMGPLSIKIQHHHGETSVLFQVANSATKDAIDDSLPKLREMLNQQGILLSDAQVQHQEKNTSSDNSHQEHSADSIAEITEDDSLHLTQEVLLTQGLVDVYS